MSNATRFRLALIIAVAICLALLPAWSKAPAPGVKSQPKTITNSIGMKLVLIPAGKFTMGLPTQEREVDLTMHFYMGVYEVTQAEYRRVVGSNPSYFTKARDRNLASINTDALPVDRVSWVDADTFCRMLSALPTEKKAGRVYRLPTEAEWEYACRGGKARQAYHCGNVLTSKHANIDGMNGVDGTKEIADYLMRTTTVGSYPPNGFGLHDMHGNVSEWCQDWYAADSDKAGRRTNPKGPSNGSKRVMRGGSWVHVAEWCRSASRGGGTPESGLASDGFRVVSERSR